MRDHDDLERFVLTTGVLWMPIMGLLMLACVFSAAVSLIALGYDGVLPLWAATSNTDVDDDLRYAMMHWRE
jgi:nicotinamidase-related amidase